MQHLIGVYDKINGKFSLFHFVNDPSDAIRGFILQMAQPCDLSFFHDDFEIYELGLIDPDTAHFSSFESRRLLITGSQAYQAMKTYNFVTPEAEKEE